jgi:hypothetical protein
VHHNVSTNDVNQGTMEYANLGKVGLNNRVGLSHNNILQRAHQLTCFCMKKIFGCYSCSDALSHVQEWTVLPQSNMGYSIEVGKYGC